MSAFARQTNSLDYVRIGAFLVLRPIRTCAFDCTLPQSVSLCCICVVFPLDNVANGVPDLQIRLCGKELKCASCYVQYILKSAVVHFESFVTQQLVKDCAYLRR